MIGPRKKNGGKNTGGVTPVVVSIAPELLPLTTIYLDRKRQEIPGIRKMAREADYGSLRRMGHDLKGSGGAYGLPQLSAFGSRIENAAVAGDPEKLLAAICELEGFFRSVRLE